MMNEARIEKRLKCETEKIGGKAYKFVSPGMSGAPDRVVLLPGGRMYFVELKAPGKTPGPLQLYRSKELKKLGFEIRCIDTIQKVKEFIEEVRKE